MSTLTYPGEPTHSQALTPSGDDRMDTLTGIPAVIANGAGVVAMLSGLFWMLASGRIVTRRELDTRVQDKDQIIATQAKAIEVKDQQLERLATVGETTIKILASVDELAHRRGKS